MDNPTLVALRPVMSGGGNPPPKEYSPAFHKAVVQQVQAGNNPATACIAEGLPRQVYNQWRNEVANGLAHPHVHQMFLDMDRAAAIAETTAVKSVTTDPENTAENAKWWLDRARPNDWSKREVTIVQNEMNAMFDKLRDALPEAEFLKICGILAK